MLGVKGRIIMTKVIPFPRKSRRKIPMSIEEYIDALDTVEHLAGELWPDRLKKVHSIIAEMKLCAHFNMKFREETRDDLLELVDNLYAKSQGDG
jgi:hypothetical protein